MRMIASMSVLLPQPKSTRSHGLVVMTFPLHRTEKIAGSTPAEIIFFCTPRSLSIVFSTPW